MFNKSTYYLTKKVFTEILVFHGAEVPLAVTLNLDGPFEGSGTLKVIEGLENKKMQEVTF